ncbi:MAG: hypothetical protein J5699_04210 [Bacteroidales bacterium]|nr:hypothetical protein [Bacteroidales bacterium]
MKLRFPLTGILILCLAAGAAGQGRVLDFAQVTGSNPLLSYGNASLMASLDEANFSEATISFAKENGDIIPLEGSPDSWNLDVLTQSFRRVSDRLVFSGRLGYSFFRGNEMGGQVLINPQESAISFLEEDTSTLGVKQREVYSLNGALSYSLSRRLSAGVKIDYTSADQTKFRDPRFLSMLMDLKVAPGVTFWKSSGFVLGGNLLWRHSVEQLSAGTFGTMDRQYFVLVNQGGFLGSREYFEGDVGYVSLSNTRPLADNGYGLALQVAAGRSTRFHAQLSGLWRDGYYGSRTSTSVVFCEFSGPEAGLETSLIIPRGRNIHKLDFSGGAKILYNYTNSYSYKTETGMTSVVVYNGQNKTMSRSRYAAHLGYNLKKNAAGYRPDWEFKASADALMQQRKTILYPDYRDDSYMNLSLDLSAERNIKRETGCISLGAAVFGFAGTGNPKTDGSYSAGSSKVKSFDDWLFRQFEYDTAMRAGGEFSFTWTWLRPRRIAPYLMVSDRFTSLLQAPQYLDGRFRNAAQVTLGCNF